MIPKATAERLLRGFSSNGSDCNDNNAKKDINSHRNANKPLKKTKRISSISKARHPALVEKKNDNKNRKKNSRWQHTRVDNQTRQLSQQRLRAHPVAKDASLPPKVKLMMMNRPTSTSTATDATDPRPNLDNLINISAKAATTKEYIKSFLSLLRNTPEISWDAGGNLLKPFRDYNIINILKTLSSAGDKKGFENKDVPFIRMILHGASMDPSFIRNNKAKKQLMGGSKPPLFAQTQKLQWERYRL